MNGVQANRIFDFKLTRLDLAKIGQYAEHYFVGLMCGIMDQYASLFGKKDEAFILDCRSLRHEYLPFHFPDIEILLVDTKVKHTLATSAYNARRSSCEEGVAWLQKSNPDIRSLRDTSVSDIEAMRSHVSEDVFTKCGFVVKEIARTQQAALLLKAEDLKGFGKLMFETHWALSNEYEVSCVESDLLVEVASQYPNEVFGARQMGGGFGGCIITLVRKDAVEQFSHKVREKYVGTFKKEPDFYSINLCEGVHSIHHD